MPIAHQARRTTNLRIRLILTLAVLATGLTATPVHAQSVVAISMSDTLGSFTFTDQRGDATRPLKVWYYRPAGDLKTKRIVFLLHGSTRTGQQAQQLGAAFARAQDMILIAPEFSLEAYPGDVYDFGGMTDARGVLRADSLWSLNIIEHLFDAVRTATGAVTPTYDIVGHSSGGQFVHRLVLFVPDARYRRAVVSSPGRYAFPVLSTRLPYGLAGTASDSTALRKALARDVIVIVGDRDVADQTRAWEAEVLAQGRNRFARALRFHATAAEAAFDAGIPLGWRLRVVEGVDHDPPRMVRAALGTLVD